MASSNSDEEFSFSIKSDLLLDSNDVVPHEMIGQGASSIVYKGLLKKRFLVAIKIFQPSRTCIVSVETNRMFQREVLMLSKIKHDNIIQFIGACIEPDLIIVTELVEGENLQKFLWNIRPCPLDLSQSLSFALDIARAMDSLHSNGIIHRDIKPNNIMVTSDLKRVKLCDFGLAREETTDDMTCAVGTLKWMAPELIHRDEKKHYDHKVDVYSFGIVFWELVTNQTPFNGKDIISFANGFNNNERPSVANLPEDIVLLLESCWDKDSDARPEFKEIIVSLTNLITSLCSCNSIVKPEEEVNQVERKKKKKKMKLRNVILQFFKVFRACWSKS